MGDDFEGRRATERAEPRVGEFPGGYDASLAGPCLSDVPSCPIHVPIRTSGSRTGAWKSNEFSRIAHQVRDLQQRRLRCLRGRRAFAHHEAGFVLLSFNRTRARGDLVEEDR